MEKRKLKKSEQANVWFFHSISETNRKGIPRARLLEGQWVPCADGEHIRANNAVNVEADHDLRKNNPQGTVFYSTDVALVEIANRKPYYRTGGTVGVVQGQSEIEKILADFKLHGKTPKMKTAAALTSTTEQDFSLKKGSKISTLISKYPTPTPGKDDYFIETKTWARILTSVERKKPILFRGPTASGKTKLSRLVASKHGETSLRVDFGAKPDVNSLIGNHRHDPKRGSYFDKAPFIEAIQKPGFVILDEVNRAPSAAMNYIFPILEGEETITIDQAVGGTEDRTIRIHPDMKIIATCNEGNEYSGTSQLDPAFKRRFSIIPIDYIREEEECKYLAQKTKAKKSDIQSIVRLANSLRQRYEASELSYSAGMSLTLEVAEMCEDGFELGEALEMVFLSYFPKDEAEIVKDELSAL